MTDHPQTLAERFDAERPRLVGVAARVRGSRAEAEEVVQDAWLRLGTVEAGGIISLGGWLSTVVARLAIDRLRQRRVRAETSLENGPGQVAETADPRPDPEAEAILADTVGMALAVVLDRLGPAERLAFVLHDLFGLSFDEVATVVGRSPTAARQLASRARRRIKVPTDDLTTGIKTRTDLVAAFAKASREGQMDDLLRLLDPEVTLAVDPAAKPIGASPLIRGAARIAARAKSGAAIAAAEVMLVDGQPGLVVATDGTVDRVLTFRIKNGRIVAIEVLTEVARLAKLDLKLLGA